MRHVLLTLAGAALAISLLAGCQEPAGTLVPSPPPPPAIREELPPPTFQDVRPPPARRDNGQRPDANDEHPKAVVSEAAWTAGNPAKWTHIILHHSATDFGNAAVFDRLHRRQWDELGYHFVIDNGNGGADGQVEVGPRWRKQKHGAHCRPDPNDANYWNEHGIGICLVGNCEKTPPSAAQLASAARLMASLMDQCGIPERNVVGHGRVPGARTKCPGRLFPYARLMRQVRALRK